MREIRAFSDIMLREGRFGWQGLPTGGSWDLCSQDRYTTDDPRGESRRYWWGLGKVRVDASLCISAHSGDGTQPHSEANLLGDSLHTTFRV